MQIESAELAKWTSCATLLLSGLDNAELRANFSKRNCGPLVALNLGPEVRGLALCGGELLAKLCDVAPRLIELLASVQRFAPPP